MNAGLFEVPAEWHTGRRSCLVCGGALSLSYGDTYLAQRQGWVKIGQSRHVATRMRELAHPHRQGYIWCPPDMDRAEPLILLHLIPGDVEHELHQRWAACHAGGEWFRPSAAMAAWLAELCWTLPAWPTR